MVYFNFSKSSNNFSICALYFQHLLLIKSYSLSLYFATLFNKVFPDSTLGQRWANVSRNNGPMLTSHCWASRGLSSRPIFTQCSLTIKIPAWDQQRSNIIYHWYASVSPMLASQFWPSRVLSSGPIFAMLANYLHSSIRPTKVQHKISLVCQCWPNVCKPMLAQWSFV